MTNVFVIVALAGGLAYLTGASATAWMLWKDKPWRVQHFKHHRDGRFETYRDHPVRNTFGILLNVVVWPYLWAKIAWAELRPARRRSS